MRKYFITLTFISILLTSSNSLVAENNSSFGVEQLFNPRSSQKTETIKDKKNITDERATAFAPAPENTVDSDIKSPQIIDYTNNLNSNVFGANLFYWSVYQERYYSI